MREDAELVELSVGGDSAAFSELYERYFDNVYDFLARMVKDREEAADLAQDTFLRAMNSLSSLTKGGSFKSWLFTIARNTALNRLERSSRLQPLEQQSEKGESLELQVVDPDRFSKVLSELRTQSSSRVASSETRRGVAHDLPALSV